MSNQALDLFAEFATNEDAEVTGVKQEFKGVTFLIARSGNREYGKLLTKLINKNQRVLDGKDAAADAMSDKIMVEVIAKTILKGWEGNIVYKGEPMPYSVENAKTVLTHKDFRAQIMKMADDSEKYRVVQMEEEEKN